MHRDSGAAFVYVTWVALLAVVWLLSIAWAFRDARRRGKSGALVALMVLLLPWPAGVIAWLIFRPSRRAPGIRGRNSRQSWPARRVLTSSPRHP